MRFLLAIPIVLAATTATLGASAGSTTAPTVRVNSVTVNLVAQTVTLRTRVCASVGPGAGLVVIEKRSVGATVRARLKSYDPMGVDLATVESYECFGYMYSSVIAPRLLAGGGVYSITVRVKDGYAKMSAPVVSSVTVRE